MEKLVYVKPESNGLEWEYELYYSETPDIVWGDEWEKENPSLCFDLEPDERTYSSTEKVKTALPFSTAVQLSCFSMEYCTMGMLALAWIDIEHLEEYPENGRCVLHFGDTKEKVREKLEPYLA